MEQEFKRTYAFDMVHDAQKVFRELLDALSNPGQKKNIGSLAEKFPRPTGALAAVGCTLLDQEEKMYVEKNAELAELLRALTFACPDSLQEADYLFLSSELNYASVKEIMKNAKKGTYADPHTGATLIFFCQSLYGTEEMTLEGPGINGTLTLPASLYLKNLLKIRQELETEYPLGLDFYCVTEEGELMGFPRLVKLLEGGER